VSVHDDSVEFGAVDVAPAYEVVVQHLRRAIHLGELPPGSKLPPERDLADRLTVSRATIREALRELKGAGYIDIRRGQRGGAYVREGLASNDALKRWFAAQGTDLESVSEFRLAVEPLAARRAAARGTPEVVAELTELNEQMAGTSEIGRFRQADLRFHLLIAQAADAALVRHAVEEARAALFLPFQLLELEEMRERSVPQHAEIVDAIAAGDCDRAAEAMERHLRGTVETVRRA
jgi:GntR family transcriptional regulator, transcriptional repressor for pyruvate dehydrogenase complex